MYYTTRLDEVMANAAKHRLNTIYPAVWNRGYTLYPSPVAQKAGGLRQDPLTSLPLPFQNVMGELVKQAHRQHLRLIPWFEYGLMMPTSSAIAKRHPDWLTTNQAGETVAKAGKRDRRLPQPIDAVRLEVAGANQAWLNPFHPKVQQFLTDLIVDVVKRYPVDGIQLDDHFGLPIDFGYDPYTVKLYQTEHGYPPPSNPADPEWIAWRAARLTQLMTKISQGVRAVRPSAIVSLSPNSPDFAYSKYLQDWRRWVQLGLLDEVIVQVYRPDVASLQAELTRDNLLSLQSSIPIAIGLYTGPFLKPKPIQELEKQVQVVQTSGYKGVSFFCWETTLWLFKHDSAKQVEQTFVKLFPKISSAPR